MTAADIERLISRVEERRLFLQELLKKVRQARDGSSWNHVAVANALTEASRSELLQTDLRSVIAEANSLAQKAADIALLELENDIRDICVSHQWRLDGQWPSLIVEKAVDLRIDVDQRIVLVADRALADFGRRTIERALQQHASQLIPRGFEPRKFMTQLADAYDGVAAGKAGAVPLLQVYRALVIASQPARFWKDARRTGFAELGSDQFRARLSASLEANVTVAQDGRELRLLPPIDPKNSMFVYQPAEHRFGFVGRIEFVRVKRGER